jgi:hypothetical protein
VFQQAQAIAQRRAAEWGVSAIPERRDGTYGDFTLKYSPELKKLVDQVRVQVQSHEPGNIWSWAGLLSEGQAYVQRVWNLFQGLWHSMFTPSAR